MTQAIQTRYLAPTTKRGARIKAFTATHSLTVEYSHALSPHDNHRSAAQQLAVKEDWPGYYYGGSLPNGDMVFVWGFGSTPIFTVN